MAATGVVDGGCDGTGGAGDVTAEGRECEGGGSRAGEVSGEWALGYGDGTTDVG